MTEPTLDLETTDDQPQDAHVPRRWFLNRFAWVSTAAATGTLLLAGPAGGSAAVAATPRHGRPPSEDSYAEVPGRPPADLTELTLAQIATYVRRGTVTPARLVDAYVDRIEEFDGAYQAYKDRPSRAELLQQARRKPPRGSTWILRGVGLAPKDNHYTADLLTEGGSAVYEGFQPAYDATAVRLLREAGGLVLGKATMGPLAGGRATVYGTTTPTTRNAWTPDDVRYSPGGSSSGPATAVAARLATAGIGTQTGGSITGPGQAQGLTCLKPTFGRTSLHGVIPLTFTRDHVGPMCRDAKDAAIMLQVLAHPDPADPRTLGLPAPPDYARAATPLGGPRKPRLRWRTRIGYFPGWLTSNDANANQLRRAALETIGRMGGAEVVGEVTLPDDWDALTSDPLGGSYAEPTAAFIEQLRADVRPFAQRLPRFLNGMLQSGDTYIRVQQARYLLAQRMLTQLFDQCDVVFTTDTGAFDGPGFPLICFPIGFGTEPQTGLTVPRGAQLAARPFGEERLLSVAAAYQAVTDFHTVRPPDPSAAAPPAASRVAAAAVVSIEALDAPDTSRQ
jgi:aspartyl-tRNA(Asn)/glutamyl-tRNA(Gln) amidotransferase subunit A